MEKALREGKLHTSWINPNAEYEKAVQHFVAGILDPSPDNRFLEDFKQFQPAIARAGMWNSVSQVLLKIASPGVPDFYQGNEIWNLQLVDPDNRGAVDYKLRREMLTKLQDCPDASELAANPCDGAIKMHVTNRALRFRREHREVFSQGSYQALTAEGSRASQIVAFARTHASETVIALAGRFFLGLPSPAGEVWGNTAIALPKKFRGTTFEDAITGRTITAEQHNGVQVMSAAAAFASCPVALLFASLHK
jgi:(1->4)-alpha-D-glucan 1-alpha-D-glucosylmutase